MAFVFFHHCGRHKHLCEAPPRTARHSAAAPAHHYQPQGHPGLEAFHHFAQTLGVLGLWKHSQNVFLFFFCAIEKPAWKIPAASISLPQAATPNCSAARFCVTKGISPANVTFEQARTWAACFQGNHKPSMCVLPLSYLIEFPVCTNINTVVLTHDELVNRLIISAFID